MDRRDRLLLVAGVLAAAGAVGAAFALGGGRVDPVGPAPNPLPPGSHQRRGVRDLVLPPGVPGPAAERLRTIWGRLVTQVDADAAVTLDTLAAEDATGALAGQAPAAIEALAPVLEVLIRDGRDRVPAAAMRAVVALAARGGAPGKAAVERTGLVHRAFAIQADAGEPALRVETARLLGLLGGKTAADRLALLVHDADPSVVEASIYALAQVGAVEGRIPREAAQAIYAAVDAAGSTSGVRTAALAAFHRLHKVFRTWGVAAKEAKALADPDPAVRAQAATNLGDWPAPAAFDALVAALGDRDPRIQEPVAHALRGLRDPRAVEPLEKSLATVSDPRARKAMETALAACRAPLPPPR